MSSNKDSKTLLPEEKHGSDTLSRFLADLKHRYEAVVYRARLTLPVCMYVYVCRNPDVQAKAAHELRLYVEGEAREMNSESFTKYMNDLNRRIFDLVNSSDTHEKMGGIMVIGM